MKGDETAEECAEELRSLTNRFSENSSLRFQLDIPNMDVESGYGLWADTCDDFHNPLIAVEGPIIRQLIDSIPPGRALDAACGTGRYARYLSERGHAVSGVDFVTGDDREGTGEYAGRRVQVRKSRSAAFFWPDFRSRHVRTRANSPTRNIESDFRDRAGPQGG